MWTAGEPLDWARAGSMFSELFSLNAGSNGGYGVGFGVRWSVVNRVGDCGADGEWSFLSGSDADGVFIWLLSCTREIGESAGLCMFTGSMTAEGIVSVARAETGSRAELGVITIGTTWKTEYTM